MKNINWANHIIEFTLIITGILIALQIDRWREERKNKVDELFILNGIQRDLAIDTMRFICLLIWVQGLYRQANKF